MVNFQLRIPALDIDTIIFSLDVSKKYIKEVNDAFYCERIFNKTDIDLEKCEFIYSKIRGC